MSAVVELSGHDIDTDVVGTIEFCYEHSWTEGLPVVLPEAHRVQAMLAMEG